MLNHNVVMTFCIEPDKFYKIKSLSNLKIPLVSHFLRTSRVCCVQGGPRLVLLEIIYFCMKSEFLWQFSVSFPKFCTTFVNDTVFCTLDYRESSPSFLERYEQFCEKNFIPKITNPTLSACPCIPESVINKNSSDEISYEITTEGTLRPRNCTSRQTVAIIIPYRNRSSHLVHLIKTLEPMLQRQMLTYQVFVIEQKKPHIFNKAMLMNAGFLEISKNQEFDCFIFHDVDMIPLDATNFYVCVDIPRHLGGFVQLYNFELLYEGLFGGVTAFRKDHFKTINGFSNKYYGWGGEDDDILQRVKTSNMMVNRFPPSVSRYAMLLHQGDPGNPGNQDREKCFINNPNQYKIDGLNSISYIVESVESGDNYTKISVSLPDPPSTLKTYDRTKKKRLDSIPMRNWFIVFTVIVMLALFIIYHSR